MKLSEAIRAGAKKHPQGFGRFKTIIDKTSPKYYQYATCAIGAALDGIGKLNEYEDIVKEFNGDSVPEIEKFWKMTSIFPLLNKKVIPPYSESHGDGSKDKVKFIIFNLNDGLKWSRERIADWVATIEQEDGH